MPAMRYARRLSPRFLDHLENGPLRFLVSNVSSWNPADPYAFDLQIREGDRLMYYHGTTALLTIRHDPGDGVLECTASSTYTQAAGYEHLMKRWPATDQDSLCTLVPTYLVSAASLAKDGYYRNREEGYWQNRLCFAFSQNWCPGMDWLIIDREAVVGFGSDSERRSVLDPIQVKYQKVKDDLQRSDPKTWGQPNAKGLGIECDLLALGPSGELYCIELKHGSNASGVYWGCLQVAVYREVFATALPHITDDIKTLVRQKVSLGLLPRQALSRLPQGEFRNVLPILAIADPNDLSSCWTLLGEVMRGCPDARTTVAEIRNYEDPAPVIRTEHSGAEFTRHP